MKALLTGARGTVGRALSAALGERGVEVVGWDRPTTPIGDADAEQRLLDRVAPDAIFHLAAPSAPTGVPDEGRVVTCDWTRRLAESCRTRDARFLFTSTAMVFTNDAVGPFTVDSAPDAVEGYGGEKRAAERIVADANPDAVVARLGWQIGSGRGGNHMVEFLASANDRDGRVGASRRWLPACSFLEDTVAALARLALDERESKGLRQIDSNERWTFYEIASALNRRHGGAWRVEPTDDFVYDQRMPDDLAGMPSLSRRLPELP